MKQLGELKCTNCSGRGRMLTGEHVSPPCPQCLGTGSASIQRGVKRQRELEEAAGWTDADFADLHAALTYADTTQQP